MHNLKERDKYENVGREYVTMLFDEINRRYPNTTITDITIPDDPTTTYDMTATINGNIYYIENKTRGKSYDYTKLKDKGFLLRARKNNGENQLFSYIFPNQQIVMLTTPDQLSDITPEPTKVKHKYTVDEDSAEDIQYNYNVPLDKWWVYRVFPWQIINKPKKL